jgi:taurine--2-oxoglutarate transaminase
MFAVDHWGVVPDILTMAKGLTSSAVPLGAMGVRRKIADYFRDNVFWGGLTYNAHSFACAVALAAVDALVEDGMVENAARMEGVMREEFARLKAKHRSFKLGRCIGLFGTIEVQRNSKGDPICGYDQSHPAMNELSKFFRQAGLFTFVRWDAFMCNPPLCISEAQLREGFAIIDRGLDITDAVFEG